MSSNLTGNARPLGRVILLSALTFSLYYGYYKWVIQDELKRYTGKGWSGAVCLLPFVLGVAVPQLLRVSGADVPGWTGWLSLLGIAWIYIVQFRLYRAVNELYRQENLPEPLTVWWLFVPGLNLVVGLRQIHFLSQFWARQRGSETVDPIAKALPLLFAAALIAVAGFSSPASAASLNSPLLASLFHFSGTRPSDLGVKNGRLVPCPATPNCVNSQTADAGHTIAPLRYDAKPEEAFAQLKQVVQAQPRTEVIKATDSYLYAEATSAIMGFVDDVEFYLDREAGVIQVRSASRLGESDLGVNRQRIETIRADLQKALP